ncbi:MAG: hypothetical protein NTZ63_01310 [Candidatus Omnitrophica bacterium]|nr:hypothetical protein [Candidatus Omnitrophota bacterium]
MKRKKLYLAILASLVLTLTGCTSMFNKNSLEPLKSQVALKFQDIPVPAGFRLLQQNSYSFESTGLRACVLRYQGPASIERVINFYKEQMPMYNWNLLNVMEYGDCVMNFERETESCIINIAPKGSNSLISISMGPKSQGFNKRSKSLLK